MKKNLFTISKVLMLSMLLSYLAGCMKDKGALTYTLYLPIKKSMATIRAEVKVATSQTIKDAGKIYTIGNTIFLNEKNKGVHVIDNSNPANPINKAFINIPGNYDIAIRNNVLYADCYTDLIALDVSNITNIAVISYLADVYPERRYNNGFYADSGFVVVDYIKKDTTVDASFNAKHYYMANFGLDASFLSSSSNGGAPFIGTGGSMTKFTIVNDKLYSVNNSYLFAIDIANPYATNFLNKNSLALGIGTPETIYPFQDKLFIGSTAGMYMYSIANPNAPQLIKTFTHATGCDPVISDGNYAYITLHSGTRCNGIANELDVVDVSNIQSPTLVKTYSMTSPKGLAKDGSWLMICDDSFKVFDASNPANIILKKSISISNSYDVICKNNIALISAKDGLYQYNYSDINNIQLLSKIAITQ